jgi:two-component system sensor histidine kinase KdpD
MPADCPSICAGRDATIARVNRRRCCDWVGYACGLGVVAAATAVGWPLVHSASLRLASVNVLMLYLLGVLWVATRFSRGAAVLTSVLGVAVFDFAFVEPYYTFAVADRQYVVTFAVMLLTALVISTLTHRARQQSELARQAWERTETEFLRNTLLSGVSHELRTPLSAIAGAASGLCEHDDGSLSPETRAELLDIIRTEADRMERLVGNLLDMTRLESGGLVVKKEWVPLAEVVGSALRRMERRLGDRPVRTDIPPDLPMVHADAVLLEQVLSNLIDNVIEYSPPASPVEISAVSNRDGNGSVVIEIADRGPGLPPGTERRVFEKFFRAYPAETRRGVGLGLAIVRGIVEAHGGNVTAENRAGGGAVFRVSLPASSARASAIDTSA